MNIWSKYIDDLIVIAPLVNKQLNPIYSSYNKDFINFVKIPNFNLKSTKSILLAFFIIPLVMWKMILGMQQADHIHLRCPGNMGLLAAVVQICFPKKKKTAKYAGNWDPKAKQPFSYKVQRWLLSNTLLTQNMQVLVYGEWPNPTQNIKPFFTATYSATAMQHPASSRQLPESTEAVKMLFVGTLTKGKQPLYAIQLVEKLHQLGKKVALDCYGEGVLRSELETYLEARNLADIITLKGNQSKDTLEKAYQNSHFLILPSKSEGWPKAVAEAMFWGCVPVATAVSCVPYMLDYGSRGVLLQEHLEKDTAILLDLLNDSKAYELKSKAAQNWSQHYTIELFEAEIKKLLAE